ncbi:hypothetical protein CAPTEDRAFT_219307 [Capitella teleta]|uniref:Serine/threonine-protein kinase RIO3 n=1 Tax=Capitella teleta TaxID=283909 RepID=R7UI82_CAPTE|nr:hypothetical protein CAPTEDRAFT_219307 [Capitella teleta]|eukprot:ELU05813.1 hypothetical protein CAPTEDRAFT_219307 [Capitella teleta]
MSSQTMAAPVWGKISTPSVVPSLGDVMSEELAHQLACEEGTMSPLADSAAAAAAESVEDKAEASDLLLAQMLQHEFDRENDLMLKKEEDKLNGTSNGLKIITLSGIFGDSFSLLVRLSYQKYRSVHPALQDEEDEEEEEELLEDDFIARRQQPQISKNGASGKGKNMTSKHDANICGRRNTAKMDDQFPLEFDVGDSSKVKDMRLSNQVYSQLKQHAQSETKRSHRVYEKKDHATAGMVVDQKTRLLLYKMLNMGLLDQVNGVISSGKESVVYHARGGQAQNVLMPPEVAIKVFKTTLSEFKNRCQYVKGDVRFFKDQFKKQNPRKIMRIWAEKESVNLKRMSNYGIPCPRPLLLKRHVLVLEFLGKDQKAAPKLKDAELSTAEWQLAYEQVVQDMTCMYQNARLVHGDLSEYNLLWHNERVYFIDVAQTVDIMHPHSMQFLLRDCHNICEFFSKRDVSTMTHYELFNLVTGKNFSGQGEVFLSQVEEYEKSSDFSEQATSKTDYPFNFFFDLAQKQLDEDVGKEEEGEVEEEEEEEEEDSDLVSWEVIPGAADVKSDSSVEDFVKIDTI